MLNAKTDKVDPGMATEIPQQPAAHAPGDEPTVEEVAAALRSIDNSKAVRSDEFPVKLLNFGLYHDPRVLQEFYKIIKVLHKRRTGRSAGTAIVDLSWHTRVRYSSK